jgi:hypothetical protein
VEDVAMRGRKPLPLKIAPGDLDVLRGLASGAGGRRYQCARARIVLAVAAGERIRVVAERHQCAESTVWRLCRRYERGGLSGLLADGRRTLARQR